MQRILAVEQMLSRMRSKELNLSAYDTDKTKLGYLETYDSVLGQWVDKDIKLLEVGVHRGGSLKLWRDYFPRSTIVGIDRQLPEHFSLATAFRCSKVDNKIPYFFPKSLR